jgi:hypothetical protein
MKKLLVTLTVATVAVGAFGQGKLALQNNINQLVYMTTDTTKMVAADVGKSVGGFTLAGSSLYTGAGSTVASLTGAPSFTVGLFGGTAADNMTLQGTGVLGDVNSAGLIYPQVNLTFPSLPAGTAAFFRIDVYDSRATSAASAWALGDYAGTSGVFTAIPQVSVYSPIWTPGAPVSSTLPVGSTFVPKDYVGYAGYFGTIAVQVVPEPGTLTLAGLGLVSLLALRRRS